MSKKQVVSLRLSIEDIAKGRDTLISLGIIPDEITTISEIVRVCFYYGILGYNNNVKAPPSEESLNFVKQKFHKPKNIAEIKLSDL